MANAGATVVANRPRELVEDTQFTGTRQME